MSLRVEAVTPQLLAIGGGLALVAGLAGGWSLRDWKADSDALAALEKAQAREDKAREQVEDAAAGYEEGRSDEYNRTIERQTELRTIYRTVPVPADCVVPDAAVGVLDAARERANARAAGEPLGPVPAATGAP